MKLSELIKEIEEVEGVPYDAWCKTKSGIEIMVTPKTGAYESIFTRFLRISYKEYDISIAIRNDSIKDTICDARKKLVKLGFVDDLQDSPQEFMRVDERVDERVDDCDLETSNERMTTAQKRALARFLMESKEEVALLRQWLRQWKAEQEDQEDAVNHPSHYTQGEVECIDAIASACINKQGIEAVCVANVIKYIWRYERKNGIEDVKKAQWYLQKLIQELEKQQKEQL